MLHDPSNPQRNPLIRAPSQRNLVNLQKHPPTEFCPVGFLERICTYVLIGLLFICYFSTFFMMLPYTLSPMGKTNTEFWVQRGSHAGMVEMAPSSSKPHFTFLIYFPSHLSQCVDCIIVSVTESHASIINDSAGSKPEPHRLSQIFASPPTSVPATVGPSVFVLTALRQMPYSSAPC